MDQPTATLVGLSTLACRSDFRDELAAALSSETSATVDPEHLYEAFLQLYLFAGFPAALEAMKAYGKWRDASGPARTEAFHYAEFASRGEALYRQVYGDNASVVRDEMLRLSPDLAGWALVEGYGKTLSRPGLAIAVRELCIVAILTQLGWRRQLFSHLLGARNVGAEKEDALEAITIGSRGDSDKLSIAVALLEKAYHA